MYVELMYVELCTANGSPWANYTHTHLLLFHHPPPARVGSNGREQIANALHK